MSVKKERMLLARTSWDLDEELYLEALSLETVKFWNVGYLFGMDNQKPISI